MDFKIPPLLFTTPTITLSRHNLSYNHNFVKSSDFCRPFMSDVDQKTSLVSLLAIILGLGGFATSLISLCMGWLIPATRAKLPPMNDPTIGSGHRFRSVSAHHPSKETHTPTLRRHSSYHARPIFRTSPLSNKPRHARQVSFDLRSSPKYPNTTQTQTSNASPCPFAPKEFAESHDSSPPSSLESETLIYTPSTSDLPVRCCNAKCECYSMTPLDLDILPAFSYPSSPAASPRPFLGKRLPSMRNAFSGKRRTNSSSSAMEFEPRMRSELLRSSLDAPHAAATSIAESDSSRVGADTSTYGESSRSVFVRPFLPSRSKTIAVSPLVDQDVDTNRKSSIAFSNPWLLSRHRTTASVNSSMSADIVLSPSNSQRSPRHAFLRRFSSSKPSSPPMVELPDASYFPVKRANSVQQPKVRRTEPYGPPYNFPMPSKHVKESQRERTGSDSVLVVDMKRPKTLRRTKPRRPITAHSRQYPQYNLVEALDEKLAALQNAQTLETNFEPRYIIASESDASPEILRSPNMLPAWCIPAKY